jgi:glycosyltransferase involved in cell wall biosynthesis
MREFNLPYFIYTGNAYPHKNLEKAIRACVNLKVNFYIVTSRNVFSERLEKLIKKLNATNYVKLLGFVEDRELVVLYKNSVGFIFPSLSEGFGLPGLEAMKAETLVLCSDIPVFREIYGRQVFYFNPRNVQSIEKTISEVLSLKESERRKMIFDARAFIKRYSWEKMAKQTLEVYNSCYN